MTYVGSNPTFAIIQPLVCIIAAFGSDCNTSGFDPEVVGSNPAGAAHGLLVQRITVYQTLNLRDQGSNPWLPINTPSTKRTGNQTFNLEIRVQIPLG